jgi:hypothetical protein
MSKGVKAVVLEKAVETFSDGMLSYVGDEVNGCDFVIPSLNNTTVEMKYCTEALYHKKHKTLKAKTKTITLLNSKGTNTHQNLPDDYSDYLLIVETYGAAVISKENLKKYVISNGDSLSATIPTNELTIIFSPSDVEDSSVYKSINIKQQFLTIISAVLSSE